MLSTPFFSVGNTWLRPVESDTGPKYQLAGAGGRFTTLPASAVALLLLADGQRTVGDIYDASAKLGMRLDDPARVVVLFRDLERAGMVEMAWHYETLVPVRHRCTASGMCCEGHLICVSKSEAASVRKLAPQLVAYDPNVPQIDPVTVIEDAGEESELALTMVDGHCLFLGDDRLCMIHKHLGAEAKPLICRLFPLRVVNTEEGFRVGITSRCVDAHLSWNSVDPATPEQALGAIGLDWPPGKIVGLDGSALRSLRNTRRFEMNAEQEGYFLSLLTTENLNLATLISSTAGEFSGVASLPGVFLEDVAKRLRAFPEKYSLSKFNNAGTQFGDDCRALLKDFSTVTAPESGWREPEPAVVDYIRHAIQQFVYLRDSAIFPAIELAVHVYFIGVMGALWTTSPWDKDGEVSHQLGRRISMWLRAINLSGVFSKLFDGPEDFEGYRQLLP